MQSKLSRVKIALYVVRSLSAGNDKVVLELAAYLIETKRTAELDLIIREIDEQLEHSGDVNVTVTTARGLDQAVREQISELLSARNINIEEVIDQKILGGIKLETASRRLDATVAHRINTLRNARGLKV